MFRSYLKTGFRSVIKHRWPSLINTTGLALAVGCALVLYVFLDFLYHNDEYHENLAEIYVVEKTLQQDRGNTLYCTTPEPLAQTLSSNFPQVKVTSRFDRSTGVFQYEDQVFTESLIFVDLDFFDIFSFPFKWGTPADFRHPEAIFLSHQIAEKYFGRKNPLGEQIKIRFYRKNQEFEASFLVKGVIDELPINSSFQISILIPYNRQLALGREDFQNWQVDIDATFVQIPDPNHVSEIESRLEPIIERANADIRSWPIATLKMYPLTTITEHAYKYDHTIFSSSHIAAVVMLIGIGVILILLVCFNYMNTAIATAVSRLKEVSMRKVMGSTRRQLILQFLTENLIISVLGISLGILLAKAYFLKWFARTIATDIEITLPNNFRFWLFLLGLLIVILIGGSGYPALYISRLKPIAILRDKVTLASKNRFRKVLLGTQFTLTFILIFMASAFLKHTQVMRQIKWGYDPSAKAIIRIKSGNEFNRLKHQLATLPEIESITGSAQQIGRSAVQVSAFIDGDQHNIEALSVGLDYMQTMEIPLTQGRYSNPEVESDIEQAVLVNQELSEYLGWDDVVGRTIRVDSQSYKVIGELANFRHEDFFRPIQPMIYRFCPEEDFRYMTIHLSNNNLAGTAENLQDIWKQTFPDQPFNYFFQDDVFAGYFQGFEQINRILTATAFLAIFISAIGLFGLVMLIIARKMKEISIRKVLGADLWHVSQLVNKEFLWPVILAIIIGAPLGAFFVKTTLQEVSPEMTSIGLLPFLSAVTVVLIVAGVAVSGHIYRANTKNPIVHLRDE